MLKGVQKSFPFLPSKTVISSFFVPHNEQIIFANIRRKRNQVHFTLASDRNQKIFTVRCSTTIETARELWTRCNENRRREPVFITKSKTDSSPFPVRPACLAEHISWRNNVDAVCLGNNGPKQYPIPPRCADTDTDHHSAFHAPLHSSLFLSMKESHQGPGRLHGFSPMDSKNFPLVASSLALTVVCRSRLFQRLKLFTKSRPLIPPSRWRTFSSEY